MKKQLLIFVTALLSFSASAQVPNYVPTNGLVGYWPFNGNANDESGNGNNGTVNGATLTTDRFGNVNDAYSFDGIDDFISLSPPNLSNQLSIAFWTKDSGGYPNTNSINPRYISSEFCNGGFAFFQNIDNSPNGLVFTRNRGTASADIISSVITNSIEWRHIALSYDGTICNFYLDGLQVASLSNTGLISTGVSFYFGKSGCLFNQINDAFHGKLDDIGLWNRALTPTEITTLYYGCTNNITLQPANQSITLSSGNTAQFAVATSGSGSAFQWQTNLGVGFQNLSDAGQYTGSTTNALTVSNVSVSNHNQQFRCIVNDGNCSDTTSIATLSVIDDLSLQENTTDFIISPNPATNLVTITTQEARFDAYTLMDAQGRIIQQGKLSGINTVLDLSPIARGNYFLQIGNQRIALKLIKE